MKQLIAKEKDAFLQHLEQHRGYSKLTIKSYNEAIKEALQFMETQTDAEGVTTLNLMPYRLHIADLKAKTISKKLSALRSFTEFLNDNGIKVQLQADASIKVAKTLPKPISHEHITEALQQADIKEKLVVTMLYTLGLRISELCNLQLQDIQNGWVRITGKGNKQRDIPLLENMQRLIDLYMEQFHPKRFLFEKNSEKLSENSLRYIINKVFARISLKVTPHQLRHSYATALLNSGAPIVDVSELLGHSSMATTQIYTKLGSALKKQNYDKAHPLSGAVS
ncbi:MAG: tyrosine-type recombinase/integrase [Epsilonproteobacteria bacterium]|nr:tyrosine-type recombinase/integrase [Campylobacterota bacterium]